MGVSDNTIRALLRGPNPIPHLRISNGRQGGVRIPQVAFESWMDHRIQTDTARDSGVKLPLEPTVADLYGPRGEIPGFTPEALLRRDGVKRRRNAR